MITFIPLDYAVLLLAFYRILRWFLVVIRSLSELGRAEPALGAGLLHLDVKLTLDVKHGLLIVLDLFTCCHTLIFNCFCMIA